MRIRGARNSVFASSKLVLRTHAMYSGEKRITYFRGASPLGLPYTLARGGPVIPAPLAWAHSRARSPPYCRRPSPLGLPSTPARGGPVLPPPPARAPSPPRSPPYCRRPSPLGLPSTLAREPLRRLAPFAWLASLRSLASFFSRLASP